ncbi:hypothetical protein Cgig2_000581 [Carnegiea gigantea]|uniref:Protein RETICULATA-RELATED 4, chloroplastic-like n=1 Tax=Carnegiea gigantea TaxID=171969 RepID=A0A9Q1GT13_9CARY|nr:hypothetical protein Cgig2_000581 [Carnegiea gigantea]
MAIASISLSLSSPSPSSSSSSSSSNLTFRRSSLLPALDSISLSLSSKSFSSLSLPSSNTLHFPSHISRHLSLLALSGGGDGITGGNSGGGGGGDGRESGGGGESKNKKEVLMLLAEAGRSLESLPADLAAAIQQGRIPVDIVKRYLELEESPFFRWLLQFRGFKERLLADDLFLAKVAMECGVGVFTKTAAEYERRRENFFNELEIVFADVVMAVIADFMLVYLPAPTVALRPPLAVNAGPVAKFFHGCPDNAFQIPLGGASYSLIQRIGAIVRNGTKLFVVGTTASLVGTAITNIAINAKKVVDKSAADDVENVPILSTSVAYGIYMAVSSNLRYQIVGGIIEQRMLEPMLHNHKLMLSAFCFAVRTGNTFLGSLL